MLIRQVFAIVSSLSLAFRLARIDEPMGGAIPTGPPGQAHTCGSYGSRKAERAYISLCLSLPSLPLGGSHGTAMLYLLLSPPSALNTLLFSDKEVERGCPPMAGQPAGMRGKFVWENMGRQRTLPTKRARGRASLRMQSGEGLCAVLQKYVVQTDIHGWKRAFVSSYVKVGQPPMS